MHLEIKAAGELIEGLAHAVTRDAATDRIDRRRERVDLLAYAGVLEPLAQWCNARHIYRPGRKPESSHRGYRSASATADAVPEAQIVTQLTFAHQLLDMADPLEPALKVLEGEAGGAVRNVELLGAFANVP